MRGFQQSQSTKVLLPNTVQLEKAIKPLVNNMIILTEFSKQKKNRDLVAQEKVNSITSNFKRLTGNASEAHLNSADV